MILAAARSRGSAEDNSGEKRLADWLDNRPAYTFFDKIMVVMAAILRALPSDEREYQKRDIVSACARIAEASGGVVGFGSKVRKEEQELIARITAEFERGDSTSAN